MSSGALCEAGLGVVLDVVPNHMAATRTRTRSGATRSCARSSSTSTRRTGRHRRFFDVGELAGVRVEDPEVFEATHAQGARARARGPRRRPADRPPGRAREPGAATSSGCATRGVEHVWVEKILEPGEQLRDWPVEGTTGYEFLNDVDGALRRPGGRGAADRALPRGHRRAARVRRDRARGEARAGADDVRARGRAAAARLGDAPRARLAAALASFPVYRTYVEPWTRAGSTGRPRGGARGAAARPAARASSCSRSAATTSSSPASSRRPPPVMAKGVEDTAFYRYFRLLALNEVGGEPGRFSLPVDEFHAANLERARRFPRHLLASQTHDTKRSGDVRARLGALSWMPGRVGGGSSRATEIAARRCTRTRLPRAPDASSAPGRSSASGSTATSRRRCARASCTRAGSTRTRRTSGGCRTSRWLQRTSRRPRFAARLAPLGARDRPSARRS